MDSKELSHQYDPLADTFAKVVEEGNRVSRESFRAALPDLSGKKLLDMGCGEGSDCRYYQDQGADATGIDASQELITKAQERYPDISFAYSVMEQLQFAEAEFDVVVSKYALMTSEELEPIFKEAHRVLKPGGSFYFLVTHPIRQLYEKKQEGKDYFKKEIVDSVCFDGALTFKEPSHTLKEYFSPYMLENFTLEGYDEAFDPAAEKIVDTFPGFLILGWRKK